MTKSSSQPPAAVPVAPSGPKKKTLKELIEDNVAIVLASAIITGFVAGFGAYEAILKVAHRETISQDRLSELANYERIAKSCVNNGKSAPIGDAKSAQIEELKFVPVNPKSTDPVRIGTVPAGQTAYVVTWGRFDVWARPATSGVYQDPDHGGGLNISAKGVNGDTVYDGWYKPGLKLTATVDLLVTATVVDPNPSDNCCDDFQLALAPVR
jgi:hypothetical protein